MRTALLTVMMCLLALPAHAKYSGGTGEPNDPYQIATAADLIALGETPADYGKHFILTADIDLDPNVPGRKVFDKAVIGTLTGVFDGNGHTVSHLTVEGGGHLGLFGELRIGAEVRDLGVADVNITASNDYTGALVGSNGGTLTGCYSTGVVRGREDVGGLVGDNWGPAAQCYSVCAVSGGNGVGGLMGENSNGTVNNCYSTGPVRGTGWDGGLMAYNNGAVVHCFWDTGTSGQTTSAAGTGKTTAEMQTASTFLGAGWDFVGETANGTEDIWKIAEGLGYPRLSWEKYGGGTGEPNDPYQIATAADLIALGETPGDYDKHFLLTADIDLDPNLPGRKVFDKAVIAPDTDAARYDFQGTAFTGTFDGHGHTISHLTIKGNRYLGLLGHVASGAEVKNLGLLDVKVTGSGDCIGGLVGCNGDWLIWGSSVTRCYSTGAVSGDSYVGGLIGENHGQVTECYNSASVTGNGDYFGGLAGLHDGSATYCYSTGTVRGRHYVGGLVGANHAVADDFPTGSIIQCYSTGAVSGSGVAVYGLLGAGPGDAVTGCFWDTQTSGQTTSDGGTGKTTAEMQTARTFLEAGWDFVGETANGTEDIWWINEGKDYPRLSWQGPAGMVFVDIPAGTFQMGDYDGVGGGDERPMHTVTLDGFQMSKYETTNSQYAEYLNAAMAGGLIQVVNGVVYESSDANLAEPYCDTYASSSYSQIEYSQGRFTVRSRDGKAMSDHPVARVSWYGAKAFCDYYGCRLPTEAQWEYAARGGYHDPYYRYPWGGNSIDCSKANCKTDSGFCNPLGLTGWPYTSPVGYYGPQGAYRLCDMSGNLWEWCQDWYDAGYYSVSPASNPTGPAAGTYRVLRGGAWDVHGNSCDVAGRSVGSPDVRGQVVGFRVCR